MPSLPGFELDRVCHDYMHGMNLGIDQHVAGNMLFDLAGRSACPHCPAQSLARVPRSTPRVLTLLGLLHSPRSLIPRGRPARKWTSSAGQVACGPGQILVLPRGRFEYFIANTETLSFFHANFVFPPLFETLVS